MNATPNTTRATAITPNRSNSRIVDANPTMLWFTTKLPATMTPQDQEEWHQALREYMRTLGVVVHQQAGFSVAIPIGRDVLPSDRHELVNWAMDFAQDVELTLSEGHPANELFDFCEEVIKAGQREAADALTGVGLFMVLRVVTRALLDWRDEVDALQRRAH